MKKLWLAIFALLALVCVFAACEGEEVPHTHSFGEWREVTPATCVANGEEARQCDCGERETRTLAATGVHTYSEWSVIADATCAAKGEEARACACGVRETRELPMRTHAFADGACGLCMATQGLEYEAFGKDSYMLVGRGSATATSIVIPAYHEGKPVVSIGEAAFEYCSDIVSVVIPDSVTDIDEWAFQNCASLSSVRIPSTLKYMGEFAFYECYALTYTLLNGGKYLGNDENPYVCLTGVMDTGVTSFAIHNDTRILGTAAFGGCAALTSLTIPSGTTSIGAYAFSGCASLTSLTIPASVEDINADMFVGCTLLIQEEGGVYYVDKWVLSCDSALTDVSLRTDTIGISGSAFSDCAELASITIPDSVLHVGHRAFSNCTLLLREEDGVYYVGKWAVGYNYENVATSFNLRADTVGIADYAFCNHGTLASITLPATLKSIGSISLAMCPALTDIYFDGSEAQWSMIAKGRWWDIGADSYTVTYHNTNS